MIKILNFILIFILIIGISNCNNIFNINITLNEEIEIKTNGSQKKIINKNDFNYFDIGLLRKCLSNNSFEIKDIWLNHEFFKYNNKSKPYTYFIFDYFSIFQKEIIENKIVAICDNSKNELNICKNDFYEEIEEGYYHKLIDDFNNIDGIFKIILSSNNYIYDFNFKWDKKDDSSFFSKKILKYNFKMNNGEKIFITKYMTIDITEIYLIFKYEIFGNILIELNKPYKDKYFHFFKIQDILNECNLRYNIFLTKLISISNLKYNNFEKNYCTNNNISENIVC